MMITVYNSIMKEYIYFDRIKHFEISLKFIVNTETVNVVNSVNFVKFTCSTFFMNPVNSVFFTCSVSFINSVSFVNSVFPVFLVNFTFFVSVKNKLQYLRKLFLVISIKSLSWTSFLRSLTLRWYSCLTLRLLYSLDRRNIKIMRVLL